MYQKKYVKNICEALEIAIDKRDVNELIDVIVKSLYYHDLVTFRCAMRISHILKGSLYVVC